MWIQVTTTRGDRMARTFRLVRSTATWLAHLGIDRFDRVELHLTADEFDSRSMTEWLALQVVPRLTRHGRLHIEVKR
jgi:hypothetical protein